MFIFQNYEIRAFLFHRLSRVCIATMSMLNDKRLLTVCGTIFVIGLVLLIASYVESVIAQARISTRITERTARIAPPLGIAGTDPLSLRASIKRLAHARLSLTLEQNTPINAWRVYTSLYPISFLSALGHAEAARLALIENPSYRMTRQYRQALTRAIYFGERDGARYRAVLADVLRDQKRRHYSFAGLITQDSLIAMSESIAVRMKETRAQITRSVCSHNNLSTCAPVRKAHEIKHSATNTDSFDTKMLERALPFFTKGRNLSPDTIVGLIDSACVRELPGPHYLLHTKLEHGERIHYLNELRFLKIRNAAPAQEFLSARGVSYALYRPMNFYVCNESQYDLGMAYALKYAAERLPVSPHSVIEEERVRTILARTDGTARDVEELALMLAQRSAHLDGLVERVAQQMDHVARTYDTTIPVDISPYELFSRYAAFPSLFLLHNVYAGESEYPKPAHDADALRSFLKELVPYEKAVRDIGLEKLIESNQTLRELDNP